MLLEFKSMSEEECLRMIREIYPEGCVENARYFHPELEDLSEAILEQEKHFAEFLQNKFFPKEENSYYVLEVEGAWVSALRLTRVEDFYYLEALETPPKHRKKGYGSRIINEVIELLKQRGEVIICDNVKKDNRASLATHKKCGFVTEHENAINYLTGKVNEEAVGLIFRG